MTSKTQAREPIPGTTIFDGNQAMKGYALNKMCYSFNEPESLTGYSIHDLVRLAGAQGAELILWLAMRGALTGSVSKIHSNYHIPISNTAAGLLVLENKA